MKTAEWSVERKEEAWKRKESCRKEGRSRGRKERRKSGRKRGSLRERKEATIGEIEGTLSERKGEFERKERIGSGRKKGG
jgi:hypothetical protein